MGFREQRQQRFSDFGQRSLFDQPAMFDEEFFGGFPRAGDLVFDPRCVLAFRERDVFDQFAHPYLSDESDQFVLRDGIDQRFAARRYMSGPHELFDDRLIEGMDLRIARLQRLRTSGYELTNRG